MSAAAHPEPDAWWQPYRRVFALWLLLTLLGLLAGGLLPAWLQGRAASVSAEQPIPWDGYLCRVADCVMERVNVTYFYGAAGDAQGNETIFWASAKFPLLAALARGLSLLLPEANPNLLLIVVARLGLWFGLAELWRLWAALYDADRARRAAWWMAFPLLLAGYTWLMVYPEGWFLGLWALAFQRAWRGHYGQAGLAAALIVLARPQGVLLLPVLALLSRRLSDRRRLIALAQLIVLPALVWLGWMALVSGWTGVPFAPIAAQAAHGRATMRWPWAVLAQYFARRGAVGYETAGQGLVTLQLGLILLGLLLLGWGAYRGRLRWALFAFALLNVLLPLTSDVFAIGRLVLPTPLPLAVLFLPTRWDGPLRRAEPFLWAALALLGALLTMIFVTDLNTLWDVRYLP